MEKTATVTKATSKERNLSRELIECIADLRVKRGLSQSALSRFSGVPQKTISRMENGLTTPSLDTLVRLLDAMNYTLEFSVTKK